MTVEECCECCDGVTGEGVGCSCSVNCVRGAWERVGAGRATAASGTPTSIQKINLHMYTRLSSIDDHYHTTVFLKICIMVDALQLNKYIYKYMQMHLIDIFDMLYIAPCSCTCTCTFSASGVAVFLNGNVEKSKSYLRIMDRP